MATPASGAEAKLIEKLRRIEALLAGATTDGERSAAAEARKRVKARLDAVTANDDPPVDPEFTVHDLWSVVMGKIGH